MPPIQESGHTKNEKAFLALVDFADGWGADYKPTKAALSIASIKALHPLCEKIVKDSDKATKIFDDLIDARMIVFNPIKPTSTRVYNAFSIIDLPQETVDGAREIHRKIQGRRATPKDDKTATETETTPTGKGGKNSSASQLSYDNNVKNFGGLVDWVELHPVYNPNEADLKVAALKIYLGKLDKANKDVIAGQVPWENQLDARDALLYADNTGMVDIALQIKRYALSAFGSKSARYKQISGLKFRKLPRKQSNNTLQQLSIITQRW